MFKETVSFIRKIHNQPESFIPLHEPRFVGKEKEYVLDTIDSTFVSSVGKYVDHFEELTKQYTGSKFAIATTNGTLALHIALKLAGVKRDELVITQPLTFIATCNAIAYLNAEPVFIDIDKKTLGLSAEALEEFLFNETERGKDGYCYHKTTGKRIAACVPMHTFGHPCEIDLIKEICNNYNIPIVEDAAESIGSTFKGKQTGTFGLLGTFSFNGNKTITCGGGGMIITDDEDLGKLAKHLTTQAKVPHKWNFEHDHIGYNYRLPNINAALACAQIEKLDEFISDKRKLAGEYKKFFSDIGIQFFSEPANSRSNYWLNSLLMKDRMERDKFLEYTNERGIMTRPSWTLMNKLPMFKNCISENIPNAQWAEDRLVNIPSSVRI
jgi:perosamine synthetase